LFVTSKDGWTLKIKIRSLRIDLVKITPGMKLEESENKENWRKIMEAAKALNRL
jgi:hypothetical protein